MAEIAGLIRCVENDRWRRRDLVDPSRALALLDGDEASLRDLPRSCVIATATLGRPRRDFDLALQLGFVWQPGEHTSWGYPASGGLNRSSRHAATRSSGTGDQPMAKPATATPPSVRDDRG
jgi:hypothetical protein